MGSNGHPAPYIVIEQDRNMLNVNVCRSKQGLRHLMFHPRSYSRKIILCSTWTCTQRPLRSGHRTLRHVHLPSLPGVTENTYGHASSVATFKHKARSLRKLTNNNTMERAIGQLIQHFRHKHTFRRRINKNRLTTNTTTLRPGSLPSNRKIRINGTADSMRNGKYFERTDSAYKTPLPLRTGAMASYLPQWYQVYHDYPEWVRSYWRYNTASNGQPNKKIKTWFHTR